MSYRDVCRIVVLVTALATGAPAWAQALPPSAPGPDQAAAAPLRLEQAESLALRRNPALAQAGQEVEALRHQAVAAGQLPDPQLSLMAQNLPTNNFSLDQQGMTMMSLGLSQTFPPFGKRGLERRQAGMEVDAARYDRAAQTAQIVLLLRQTWLQALYAGHALETIEAQHALESAAVRAALALYRVGRAPQADVLRAELARDALRNDEAGLQAEAAAARTRLAQILNLPALPDLDPAWPALPVPPAPAQLEQGLSAQPLLRAAAAETRAAELGAQAAKRNYYPEITVSAAYGRSFVPGMPDWFTGGVTVSLPLFPGKRQDQTLAAAQARALQARYRYEDRALALRQQTLAGFARYQALKTQLQRTEGQLLPTAQDGYAATLAAYSAGRADMSAVLRAQSEVLQYALARWRERRDLGLAQAELDYLATTMTEVQL